MFGDKYADPAVIPPSEAQVMGRDPADLPERVANEIGQVTDDDQQMYWNALRASGVSEARLKQLKSLNGLSRDWATHISLSLRGHHQSYDAQLHKLAEVADDIRERLKGQLADDGETRIPLSAEDYSYLSKVYTECVKEAGKGVNTMLALTEAVVRMMAANKDQHAGEEKATPGWGKMKKVREA